MRTSSTALFLASLASGLAALALCPGPARAGGMMTIGTISLTALHSPDDTGALQPYASGGGASIVWLEPDDEVALGAELGARFLSGESGRRVYDLGASFIISYRMKRKPAVPFMRLGLDLTGISAPDLDEERRRSVMTGVHGAAGVHGFLNRTLYWRAELGFLGAGPGGVTGGLSLGYTFGDK